MNNLITKLISIVCLCFLMAAILIAHEHPATGYELDIYANTPIAVWIFIIFGFCGGAAIIIYQLTTKNYEKSKIWLMGLSIIIFSRIVLLYVPYLRGYASWSGDNISYLGMIKDILQTGHFSTTNFYPITHIFLSGIIYVTGLSDSFVANLSTAFISILFVLSIYLLAGIVTHNKRKQILAILIAGVVMLAGGYNVILSPNGWSILLMPLLFYLYFNYADRRYRFLLIIILVIYPFFHPLSSLIAIIALFLLEFTKWINNTSMKKNLINLPSQPAAFVLSFGVIEFIIFTTWILAHQQFDPNLNVFWHQITTGLGSGKLAELEGSLNKINIHGFDFYILLFKMFGGDIILFIISAAAILLCFKRIYNKNPIPGTRSLFPLSVLFIVCSLLYAAYLLGLPGTGAVGGGQWDRRLLGYVEILIPIFAAITLDILIVNTKFHMLAYVGIACLILLPSVMSVSSLYTSPFINEPNDQVTLMDLTGTKWFVNSKDTSIGCTYISSPPNNFAEGTIGFSATSNRADIHDDIIQMADHFGYSEEKYLGAQYSKDYYSMITEHDRIIYSTVWKTVGRFNNTDFEKLESDPTVSSLYSNGETNFYYIKSILSP